MYMSIVGKRKKWLYCIRQLRIDSLSSMFDKCSMANGSKELNISQIA